MQKIYRLIAFTFISFFVVISFFLVVFQKDIREYFSTINNLSDREPLIMRPKPTEFDPNNNPIKVAFLVTDKYKNLVKTVVDMTGINVPNFGGATSTAPTSTIPVISTSTENIPEFKVGNPEPFKNF
ncbi:MAG: hypothetical protein WCK37_02660 [Candidatus Falkowbacteria bacterium]